MLNLYKLYYLDNVLGRLKQLDLYSG